MAANSNRLQQFARRLMLGGCNCVWVGDSISSDSINNAAGASNVASMMPGGFVRRFSGAWAGMSTYLLNNGAAPGPRCTSQTGHGTPALVGFGNASSGGIAANLWPRQYGDTGTLSDLNLFDPYYVAEFSSAQRALFRNGDWFTANRKVKLISYQDSTKGSVTKWGTQTSTGDYTPDATIPDGFTGIVKDLGSGSGDTPNVYWFGANSYVETGKNFTPLLANFYVNGAVGLNMTWCATGGSTLDDHIDTAGHVGNHATFCSQLGIDTVIIWIGQNGTVDASWKGKLNTLIGLWRTAMGTPASGRSPMFLLIAQYDTNQGQKHLDIAQYMYELSQANSDVCFYNLYARAGSFAFLSAAPYIAVGDGVHPNSTGSDYFWNLIESDLIASLNQRSFARSGDRLRERFARSAAH